MSPAVAVSPRRVQLEVCVGSLTDAIVAEKAGADRVELCSALALGGLTPSFAMIEGAKERLHIPVMVMIRPRESGFFYDEADFATMCRDARAAVRVGADGIVFGALHADGAIDRERCRQLVEIAEDREAVFHRAFDFIAHPLEAIEELIHLRVTRVLTSGQRATAVAGAGMIGELHRAAAGRIQILPGGGLDESNVTDFVRATGCDQVHMGLALEREDPSIPRDAALRVGSEGATSERFFRSVSAQRIRAVVEVLTAMG